ncbi:MAG: ATP-binding protein [Gammaproteobacteria bacterium]|nr:MAG: ATP-binding protein [Gammaproteobacteria bacterium]
MRTGTEGRLTAGDVHEPHAAVVVSVAAGGVSAPRVHRTSGGNARIVGIPHRRVCLQDQAAIRVILCHAPQEVLQRRIVARRRSGADSSEADLAVLEWQLTSFEPIRVEEDLAVIDADTTSADVVPEVLRRLTIS